MGIRGERHLRTRHVVLAAALLASLLSWWWVQFTPARTAAGAVVAGIVALWAGFALFRRRRITAGVLLGLLVLYVAGGYYVGKVSGPVFAVTLDAAPVNLDHVADMSYFRSCAGHDFSAATPDDPGTTESDRNMQHYVILDVTYGEADEIAVMAMADGVITRATTSVPDSELDGSGFTHQGNFASEVDLTVTPFAPLGRWTLRYQHVMPTVEEGEWVSAGDIIGYVPPSDWRNLRFEPGMEHDFASEQVSFDVELTWLSYMPGMGEHLDSFMTHLSAPLAEEFRAAGFDPDAAVISRVDRDASPCNGEYNRNPAGDYYNGDELRSG